MTAKRRVCNQLNQFFQQRGFDILTSRKKYGGVLGTFWPMLGHFSNTLQSNYKLSLAIPKMYVIFFFFVEQAEFLKIIKIREFSTLYIFGVTIESIIIKQGNRDMRKIYMTR